MIMREADIRTHLSAGSEVRLQIEGFEQFEFRRQWITIDEKAREQTRMVENVMTGMDFKYLEFEAHKKECVENN